MQQRRILYIHRRGALGGAVISLFKLIEQLNRNLYQPVILFYDSSSPHISHFEELGARVIILNKQPVSLTNKLEQIRLGNKLERYSPNAAQIYRLFKSLYRWLRGDLLKTWQIKQIIVKNQIDLVHHNQWGQENVAAARLAGVKQICHIRALGKLGPLDRRLSQSVDAFIYVSSAMAAYFENQGIPAHKGRVILNGVAIEEFAAAQDTQPLWQELGLRPTDRVVSNVGRLDWWKGHEFFLRAIGQIAPAFPNLKALIVGEADETPRNQAYKESLKALTQSLGLAEVVIFTGYRADIPRLMALCEVMVHTATEMEPGGRVLIEAMAAGVPLVASKAGGILDIAEDGVQALLTPPKDTQAIAAAVTTLLTDHHLAQRLSQAGRARVLDCCTVTQYAGAVQDVYQGVLAGTAPGKCASYGELL
jgi:glycosyltransferase involved in cell wall biosynthesis